MLYANVAENLKVLNESALQEVNDFILFLIQKNTSVENKKNNYPDASSLRGSLSFAANPSLIEKEKSAWNIAMKEKFGA